MYRELKSVTKSDRAIASQIELKGDKQKDHKKHSRKNRKNRENKANRVS